jgi:hypothetical protein
MSVCAVHHPQRYRETDSLARGRFIVVENGVAYQEYFDRRELAGCMKLPPLSFRPVLGLNDGRNHAKLN